jgi:NAD(P)H-flavin reductase
MLSILRSGMAADHFARHVAHVVFGVRRAEDLFLLDELAALRAAVPDRLTVTVALSDEDVPAPLAAAHPGLAFARGLVHEVAVARLPDGLGDPADGVRAYLAGPAAMVQASVRLLLRRGRLSMADIRYDSFN